VETRVSHPLLARLRSPETSERAAACREIATDPAGTLLAEALVEALGDPEPAVARAAADALVQLARASEGEVIVALLRKATRTEGTRRIHAALALARLEPPAPGLLPALIEGLGARTGDVRWSAARTLVDVGRLHPEVLGVLLGLVRAAEDPAARRMATFALRELAPDRPEAARVLLEATHDQDPHVRRAAVTALAGLLDPPPEVRTRLAALRGDRDPILARLASLTLEHIGDERGEVRP
jgi:HEAT repeat protein